MTSCITNTSIEQRLFSKEAICLPPKERLNLLLKAKTYPVVRKHTSAKAQIKEMIDLYNLLSLAITQYFPNEKSESNFITLSFLASRDSDDLVDNKLAEGFKLLKEYEELENRITAIQELFYEYKSVFPDLYELFNLDEIVNEKISSIIENSRKMLSSNPSYTQKLMERWELA